MGGLVFCVIPASATSLLPAKSAGGEEAGSSQVDHVIASANNQA